MALVRVLPWASARSCFSWFAATLFLLLLSPPYCLAQVQRGAPIYAGSYAGSCDLLLQPPSGFSPTLYVTSISIVSENGNDFSPMTIGIGTRGTHAALYNLTGAFGCANGMISVSLFGSQPCKEPSGGLPAPNLCVDYLPEHCSGTFPYSTYKNLQNQYELEIVNLCGMIGSVVLVCQGTCTGLVQCSSQTFQTVVEGGSVNASNSVVIIEGSNTTAQFFGDQLTVLQSNTFVVDASSSTNLTTIVTDSSAVYNTQATTVNLLSGPARTCAGWIDFHATTGVNISLSSTPDILTFASASVATGDGTDTWDVPTSSSIQYTGTADGLSFQFIYCIEQAKIYDAESVGQEVILQLLNASDSLPIESAAFTTSALITNPTNPAYISGVCSVVTSNAVHHGDTFSLILSSKFTNGTSAPLTLASGAKFALAITPTGCEGVSINVTFNITIQFANGTDLAAGTCMATRAIGGNGTIYFDALGVCTITVEDATASKNIHDAEPFIQHAWHRFKYGLGLATPITSSSALSGNVYLDSSDQTGGHIKTQHVGENHVVSSWVCDPGIDCGDNPIKTNDVCNCSKSIETKGDITTTNGSISAENGTCHCEMGCECPGGIETTEIVSEGSCSCETVETTEIITPEISSPTGLPVLFPTGVSFGAPTAITVTINANDPSIISFTSTSSSSSSSSSTGPGSTGPGSTGPGSTGPGSSGIPGLGGLPDGGGCTPGLLSLKGDHIWGVDGRGHKVKVLGSVVHAASSAASSATSAATSAAGAATGAATAAASGVVSVLGGILCDGGGLPSPIGDPSFGGLPSGFPSGPIPLPGALTGAVVGAVMGSTTLTPGDIPPTSTDAAVAAGETMVTTSHLPAPAPVTITVWGGGLWIPVVNNSQPLPPCGVSYMGLMVYIHQSDSSADDEIVICDHRPSDSGWAFYPISFGDAMLNAIPGPNGTQTICDADFCTLETYPNNSLIEIHAANIITGGSCVDCSLTVGSDGRIRTFTSGNITLFDGSRSYVNSSVFFTGSGIIMDNESAIISDGDVALQKAAITNLNTTVLYVNGTIFDPNAGLVTSVTGTPNQIDSAPTTGDVVLSLPSTIEVPGDIIVGAGGTLTVNGQTVLQNTTVTSLNTTTLYVGGTEIGPSSGLVTSVTGTANQITASPTAGDVVLSLPSDVHMESATVSGTLTAAGCQLSGGTYLCDGAAYFTVNEQPSGSHFLTQQLFYTSEPQWLLYFGGGATSEAIGMRLDYSISDYAIRARGCVHDSVGGIVDCVTAGVLPSLPVLGDWGAIRLFQNTNQVIDTATCSAGLSCTKSGGTLTASLSSAPVFSGTVTAAGLIDTTFSSSSPLYQTNTYTVQVCGFSGDLVTPCGSNSGDITATFVRMGPIKNVQFFDPSTGSIDITTGGGTCELFTLCSASVKWPIPAVYQPTAGFQIFGQAFDNVVGESILSFWAPLGIPGNFFMTLVPAYVNTASGLLKSNTDAPFAAHSLTLNPGSLTYV